MAPSVGLLVSHLQTLAQPSFTLDSFDIAFLIHDRTVHWAARLPATPHEPHSSVTDLIQGLFQRLHDQSFFALRARIYTTATATLLDRAMVKVTAKRLTDRVGIDDPTELKLSATDLSFVRETPAPVAPALTDLQSLWPASQPSADEDWLRLCSRFADSVERGQVLHRYHRPLAALIVDAGGSLLSAATHEGALDKTQHAELRAVQSWFKTNAKALPDGARVYVSLKPCRMCAAALTHVATSAENLKVIYLNDDPGPHARQTTLSAQVEQKSASALTVLEGDSESFARLSRSPRRD